MCQGRKEPYEKLCELFNTETRNGEIGKYTELLKKAVDKICYVFKKRSNQKRTSGRGHY